MSKVVEYTGKKFSGKATLMDPIPFALVCEWEDHRDSLADEGWTKEYLEQNGIRALRKYSVMMLPVTLKCFERFELAGLPEHMTFETFPGTPRDDTKALAVFLMGEVSRLIVGTEGTADPNS